LRTTLFRSNQVLRRDVPTGHKKQIKKEGKSFH
jgi:hypothetical protein